MSEETHTVNVVYNIENIDNSIRETQRMLYFTNALRLSIVDIQQVMAGPTLSNVMWTAVQLTRVWTHLYRIIKQTNQAQAAGIGVNAARGLAGRTLGNSATRGALGQTMLAFGEGGQLGIATAAQTSLWATLSGVATATAFTLGAISVPLWLPVAAAVATVGAVSVDMAEARRRREWRERQREVARSQGLEF